METTGVALLDVFMGYVLDSTLCAGWTDGLCTDLNEKAKKAGEPEWCNPSEIYGSLVFYQLPEDKPIGVVVFSGTSTTAISCPLQLSKDDIVLMSNKVQAGPSPVDKAKSAFVNAFFTGLKPGDMHFISDVSYAGRIIMPQGTLRFILVPEEIKNAANGKKTCEVNELPRPEIPIKFRAGFTKMCVSKYTAKKGGGSTCTMGAHLVVSNAVENCLHQANTDHACEEYQSRKCREVCPWRKNNYQCKKLSFTVMSNCERCVRLVFIYLPLHFNANPAHQGQPPPPSVLPHAPPARTYLLLKTRRKTRVALIPRRSAARTLSGKGAAPLMNWGSSRLK